MSMTKSSTAAAVARAWRGQGLGDGEGRRLVHQSQKGREREGREGEGRALAQVDDEARREGQQYAHMGTRTALVGSLLAKRSASTPPR